MGSIKSFMILCWWVLNVAAFDVVDAKPGRSDCVPSSCGHIHQIRYPFRLKQDPQPCGQEIPFSLSCENNVTVIDLQSSGKFYVQEINYTSHTIRAVDASILNNNGSSIPSYSVTYHNLDLYSYFDESQFPADCIPRQNQSAGGAGSTCGGGTYPIYFLKCTNPVNSSVYLDTSPCYNSQPNSHGYVKVGSMDVGELKDGCSVERMTFVYLPDDWDSSCTYIQNALLSGFEIIYWDDGHNFTICTNYTEYWSINHKCFRKNFTGFFQFLWQVIYDVFAYENYMPDLRNGQSSNTPFADHQSTPTSLFLGFYLQLATIHPSCHPTMIPILDFIAHHPWPFPPPLPYLRELLHTSSITNSPIKPIMAAIIFQHSRQSSWCPITLDTQAPPLQSCLAKPKLTTQNPLCTQSDLGILRAKQSLPSPQTTTNFTIITIPRISSLRVPAINQNQAHLLEIINFVSPAMHRRTYVSPSILINQQTSTPLSPVTTAVDSTWPDTSPVFSLFTAGDNPSDATALTDDPIRSPPRL